MLAAKQNQKFPFHFFSAPPTPPAEENKKSKENFWFFVKEKHQNSKFFFFTKGGTAKRRRDGGFRENPPRVFEIQKKRAGREAGVRANLFKKISFGFEIFFVSDNYGFVNVSN